MDIKKPLYWISFSMIMICSFSLQAQDKKKSDQAYKKGMQLFAQGKTKEAIKSFDIAIKEDSSYEDAWIKRGFMKGMLSDFEGELSDYNHVISMYPDHVHAYVSRGGAYNRLLDYEKGIADFNKALELDPDNQEAYNNRGFAKKGLGDKEGACDDWNKSKQKGNAEAKVILKNNYCK
ncbi:MAG: tetratricopeptide repeat protein [Bacteroidia bacterium]|jgi:tetratricopeptide (TPR) repeat protein|nr:tetratricopeptide repeat protein [Bacteroidia bacterium]MBP7245725.1 tetratricopeptide repeat protein [Bacteroidia bacterium]